MCRSCRAIITFHTHILIFVFKDNERHPHTHKRTHTAQFRFFLAFLFFFFRSLFHYNFNYGRFFLLSLVLFGGGLDAAGPLDSLESKPDRIGTN